MKSFLATIILLLSIQICARAQFYTTGDDPASLKWYRLETSNYKIIYPEGLDSLSRVYAKNLEYYRIPLSYSAGFAPGQMTRTKMPVILHPYNSMSNGVVVWAPKRMEFFTSPQAYAPEPMPWEQMLAIHESRHAAQMQMGLSHVFRPFNWIFGQMWTGAISGLYMSSWLLEGDAVVAETALSKSGRGRTADLLNWYMIAFDNGDFRRSRQWKYGSYRYYTPNEYALGYLFISGIRYLYDCPDYTARYVHYAAKKPYNLLFQNTLSKSITGEKMPGAFNKIAEFYHGMWSEEKKLRAPFIPYEYTVPGKIRRYTEYTGSTVSPQGIYTVKSSLVGSRRIMLVDSTGKERTVTPFAADASKLSYSPSTGRIYWSESVPDERWGNKVDSRIRYYDTGKRRKKSITGKGKYFNPGISEDLGLIAVAEYPVEGGSGICVMDIDGKPVCSLDAPDSLQVVETAWCSDSLYVSGISDGGFGLYRTVLNRDSGLSPMEKVLGPARVRIKDLREYHGRLMFTSDRTGVNEMYMFDPGTGKLTRMTSTPYGATDFQFSDDGKELYYSVFTHDGKILAGTPVDSLQNKKEDFGDIHVYRVAEKLSLQEKQLAEAARESPGDMPDSSYTAARPVRYRKFPHLFNIHSWAPVYFDFDNIKNLSFDHYYDMVSLGTAALMQNHLGTFTASIGYSAHKDPYDRSFWRHSGHAKFTYSGLYPVIEASIDFNDRAARNNFLSMQMISSNSYLVSLKSESSRIPSLSGRVAAYIPFNFSSGGWYRGLIPQIAWSANNDMYIGKLNQTLSASVRAYTMLGSATSEIYPDWGIGVEAGMAGYIGLKDYFSPVAYAYVYGYLPGIFGSHGIRLTATGQFRAGKSSLFSTNAVNTLPRGIRSSGNASSFMARYSSSVKLTAEYALPVYLGDFNITSAFYVKRAVLTPHFDISLIPGGNLFSTGISAAVEFGCFFWIGTPVSIGVTYSFNGGSAFRDLSSYDHTTGRHYVGPVFNITIPQ